jgi:hypothetical protein
MKYGDEKTKQVTELEEAMKKFLAKGGKIEKLPACMTTEEYQAMKKRKKAKSKK